MIQFSKEELQNLLVFLNRTQITGLEADVLVMLKLKLRTTLEAEPSRDGVKEEVPVPLGKSSPIPG